MQRLWSLTAIFWDRRRKMESIFSQKSSPMSKPPKGLPTTTIIPNLSNPYLSKYSSINLKTIIFQKYIYYYLSTSKICIYMSESVISYHSIKYRKMHNCKKIGTKKLYYLSSQQCNTYIFSTLSNLAYYTTSIQCNMNSKYSQLIHLSQQFIVTARYGVSSIDNKF